MRILKRILLINRHMVRGATPYMFVLGTIMAFIIGISILTGKTPEIDFAEQPLWVGYVCLYGGFFILISFAIDSLIFPFLSEFWGQDKPETLQDRIMKAESGS